MADSYKKILDEADQHFSAVIQSQPQNLQCRRGCSLCCQGLFEIGAADVALIAEGLSRVDPAVAELMTSRASAIFEATKHPNLRECTPRQKEKFFARTEDLACPALDESGACLIYDSRPLVCRTFGLPIRTGERYMGEECELNFTAASQSEKEAAAWDLLREDELGPEDEFTIPEAILLASRVNRKRKS